MTRYTPRLIQTANKNKTVIAWVPKFKDWYSVEWDAKRKRWRAEIYDENDGYYKAKNVHPTHWVPHLTCHNQMNDSSDACNQGVD